MLSLALCTKKNNVGIKEAFAASRFTSLDIMQASVESVAVLEGRWCNSCNNEYVRYFDWAYVSAIIQKPKTKRVDLGHPLLKCILYMPSRLFCMIWFHVIVGFPSLHGLRLL